MTIPQIIERLNSDGIIYFENELIALSAISM